MNNSKIFVVAIVLLLVVAVLIELSVPKRFNWEATFDHDSKQPFGCALFDSLAEKSIKNGYKVKHTTFYQLLNDSTTTSPLSAIYITSDFEIGQGVELKSLIDFVKRGNKVLICSGDYSYTFEDTLQVICVSSYYSFYRMRRAALSGLLYSKDSIMWSADSVYDERSFKFVSDICDGHFKLGKDTVYNYYDEDDVADSVVVDNDEEYDSAELDNNVTIKTKREEDLYVSETSPEWKPLAWKTDEHGIVRPVVMRRKMGEGELILCSTPLIFTNYGIMDGGNIDFVYRVLNLISDHPMLRIADRPLAEEHVSESPMRFFLSQPPLRWAVYLALFTLLLFVIFTARRRQRAIPIIKKPENHQLEFTKLIGTLYYQDGAHADLVRKKYAYFAEYLRREVQADVDDDTSDDENFSMLSRHTGMQKADIGNRIKAVRRACRNGMEMTVEEMIMYIDYMNEIISKLSET